LRASNGKGKLGSIALELLHKATLFPSLADTPVLHHPDLYLDVGCASLFNYFLLPFLHVDLLMALNYSSADDKTSLPQCSFADDSFAGSVLHQIWAQAVEP
jgi:hypothetical protein